MAAKNGSTKKTTSSVTKASTAPVVQEYRLVEGAVDPAKEHIGLQFGEDDKIIARVAPGPNKTFIIQYLVEPDLFNKGKGGSLEKAQQQLTFYLLEHGPQSVFGDPWEYVKYHCGTSANIYSSVHWGWYPDKSVSAEDKQRHSVNKKKVFVCPKCESKFIVSGTVSFTCPECKKAELVPFTLSKNKQVEQIQVVYCPSCYDGVPNVEMIVPGDCFHQCLSCKKVSIGKAGIPECPYCGYKKLVESYSAKPVEKVCKACRDSNPALVKDVEKGGILFTCMDCGSDSAIGASTWIAELRRDLGRPKTGWAQVDITYNQCVNCNPLLSDVDYTVKKGKVVFRSRTPNGYRVVHGEVAENSAHVVISHDDIVKKGKRVPLACLSPGDDKYIHIQYLVPADPEDEKAMLLMFEVKKAIAQYAMGAKITKPWAHMKSLCASTAKSKSKVHWEYKKGTAAPKKKDAKSRKRSRKG